MKPTTFRGRALACGLLATTALASPAFAQSAPPPKQSAIDENGVDLTSGWVGWSMTEGTIGSGEGALSLSRTWAGAGGWTDNWSGRLYRRTSGGVAEMVVEFGGLSDRFSISGGSFTSQKGDGATLTGGSGSYTYTAADGTAIAYASVGPDTGYAVQGTGCTFADAGTCAVPLSVTRPNGMTFTLSWDFVERCSQYDSELNCIAGGAYARWRGVSSSANYGFTVNYATDTPGGGNGAPQSDWYKRTGATFANAASSPPSTPTVSYSYSSTSLTGVTDTGGRSWTFGYAGNGHLSSVQRPGTSAATSSWSYGTSGVSSATIEGVTTSYSATVSGSTRTTIVTNALSQATSVVADASKGRITSVTDPLSRTTGFQYDTSGRLTRTTLPEGNYVQLSYDARGNVTETRAVAKSGSGLSDIVATASFDSACSNPVKCNKPNSATDARGHTTDYTYDSTHGGLLTATAPAAPSGTRPQTRYSYSQVTAVTGQPVYLLTGISACQSSSSCSGGSDEAKTTISYNTTNLLPTGTSSGNGSGTLTAASAMSYDSYGNLISIDGPLSGSADTIAYKYNMARERTGEISPDPDGGGSLKHRATRRTIDSQGLVTKVEAGTVLSQSDSDWANFSAIQAVETSYDGYARPTVQKTTAGGTTYALTQTGYDALGRIECVATRMNGAAWTSLPSSACSLGTEGSFGPDRIVKNVFDAAGQVTQVKSAVGTSLEAADVTSTYRSNGQAETLTDAENNKTTYEYDGHDRLAKTRFPSTTKGAGTSSTTDYEQYGWDPGGNRTSFRNRGGDTISFTFDANGRMTAKDLPGSEPDVSYAHDLLGQMASASQSGNSLSFTWDALGRPLTQGGPQGTYTSTFDLAGRRTRLTHPDGNYFDYDWLVTGDISKIRENGASSGVGVLATYNYDTSTNAGQLGQVTAISFGNGMSRSFSYDAVLRLTSLGHDLSGTTYDQTLGFSYNPASQITQNTRSNDLYAWSGHYNFSRSYTANGLNQYTAAGSTTPTYDSKGNLTSAGSTTFTYSSENLLKTASGGITLAYDPGDAPLRDGGRQHDAVCL
jgi:YD repeat-containing protein